MERHLLLVDDEENIISSLQRLFRREDYIVHTASSGIKGLEILRSQPIGVIISDQMMPEMTGVEFLYEAQSIQPDSIRMVLSGYTELKTILESINRGAIWRFLTKPWDDQLLKENVQAAFRQYELKNENMRLAADLKVVNDELQINNRNLEILIEEKTRSLQINLRLLQVSQDVLEQLPIGIIGIDTNGLIVLANKKANNYFTDREKLILGKEAKNLFSEEIYKHIIDDEMTNYSIPTIDVGDRALQIHIHQLKPPSQTQGTIIILSPTKASQS